MSYVTNLILHMSILENDDEQIKKVNTFFGERENPLVGLHAQPLPKGWYGGTKYLECHVFVGAYNYFHLTDFIAHLQTITWEDPENLQLFIKEQHDTRFRLVFGIPEHDQQLYELKWLLLEASEWIDDLEKFTKDGYTLSEIRKWREKYKRFYPNREEPENTVDGNVVAVNPLQIDTPEPRNVSVFVESENCKGLFFHEEDYAKMHPEKSEEETMI